MLPRLTKKPPKSAKLPLRERASLRFIMTWTNIISILAASLIAGYYALTLLYQNKLSDTWAIMFLELEHQGTLLTERLSTIASTREADAISDAVFRVPDGKTLPLPTLISTALACLVTCRPLQS
jgi:small-conductance mechanosensitive channel